MKNFIYFLLLIAICVTTYVVIDDHIRLRDQTLQQTSTTSKVALKVTGGSKHNQSNQLTNSFEANGTEPFWAAQFSGSTLQWQSPDLGNITINGLVGPSSSGLSLIWTHTASATTIIVTPGACNNGMSEEIFSGSIDLTITGQSLQGCVSY